MSPAGCGRFFHKTTCLKLHTCAPVPRTPTQIQIEKSSASTLNPQSQYLGPIRAQLSLSASLSESDEESEEEEVSEHQTPSFQVVLRPSALDLAASPSCRQQPPASGQEQLLAHLVGLVPDSTQVNAQPLNSPRSAQHHQWSPTPQSSDPVSQPLALQDLNTLSHSDQTQHSNSASRYLDLLPSTIPQAAAIPQPKGSMKQKSGAPQLTRDGLEIELLQREIVLAKTKITSLDNTVSELKASNSILLERIRLFEERENNIQFAQYFPGQESSAPTQPSPLPPCHSCSQVLNTVGNIQCQLEDVKGSISLLLQSSPYTAPLYIPTPLSPAVITPCTSPPVSQGLPVTGPGTPAGPAPVIDYQPTQAASQATPLLPTPTPSVSQTPPEASSASSAPIVSSQATASGSQAPPEASNVAPLLNLHDSSTEAVEYLEEITPPNQGVPKTKSRPQKQQTPQVKLNHPNIRSSRPRTTLLPTPRPKVWLDNCVPPKSASGNLFLNDQLPSYQNPRNARNSQFQNHRGATRSTARRVNNSAPETHAVAAPKLPEQTEALLIDLN